MRRPLVALVVGVSLVIPAVARAQAPGDRTEAIHPLLFQVLNDNIALDPAANVAPASRIEFTRSIDDNMIANPGMGLDLLVSILDKVGVSIPGWLVDVINGVGDFSNVSIDAKLGPFFNADYGGYFQVQPSSQEGIDLKAAINVTNNVPAMNSFKCGDEIAILTGAQGASNASLTVRPSFYDFQLGPVFKNIEFGARVGLDIDLCVGLQIPVVGCAGYTASFNESHEFGIGVPLPSFLDPIPPLANVCKAAFRPGANESDLLGCTAGPVKPLFDLWQHSLDALNAVPGVHYTFAEFSPGKVRLFTPDLPSPINLTVPQVEALFQQPSLVSTLGAAADGSLVAAATQTDLSTASVDVISLLEYAGIPTSVSLGGGLGSVDLGDVSPTFHVDQNMRYEFKPAVSMSMNLAVPMSFRVIDPGGGQVATGNGTTVDFKPGQTVMLSFPHAQRTPVTMTNTYSMNGTLNTRTSHQYRLSVNFKALHLAGPGFDFSALDENLDLSGSILPEHVIENHTLSLPAFTPVTLAGLTLDPEDPRIDVTEHAVRDSLNIGGGDRAVVYRTSVANTGDVNVLNAGLNLDLARVFGSAQGFQAVCVASPDFSLNTSYNGRSAIGLLAPGTTLEPGQAGTVDVLVRVTPQIARVNGNGCFTPVSYTSSSFASGSSPIGTPLRSNFDQCAGVTTGPDTMATVDLGASTITKVADFAIYGTDSVVFDGTAGVSYGNVGTGGSVQFKKSGGAEPLRIVGDMHTGHDLHLEQSQVLADYVQVHDHVHVDKKSALVVNGALSESSDCNTAFDLPSLVFVHSSGSSPRIVVPDNGAVVLDAGDYRSIQVRARGTLTLRAGVYNIDDLAIAGDSASVVFDISAGTITLNIGSWKNGNSRGLKFLVPAGATRAVRINYAGNGELSFTNAVLQGTLVAPDAGVKLDEGSLMLGSLRARRVTIGAGTTFVDHHHLEPLKIDPACASALQSASVPVIVGR
jgi:hypothetical protein